ncbi:MAG: glycoside hydrolase family 38 C-terminal domain-containing protein [Promethearchaeota archaeon]
MNDKSKEKVTHIISHTHWDREWYLPFQNFRFRLVKMIDRCLEIFENDPSYKGYFFDGQTCLIEDYLEIKPENKLKLKKHIQAAKIGIGPWYVQCSPWLQTGEGIIRNLLFGYHICKEYGVDPVPLGYVPDQFIMFPMFPQIMNGFDIYHMAFQRPMNDQYEKYGIKSEFKWESDDGSNVIAFHLRAGYGMAGFLPNDKNIAFNQLLMARSSVEAIPHATNQILMFNGSDHTDPDKLLPELIELWNSDEEIVEEFGIAKHSTWQEFIRDFMAENPELVKIKGELSGVKYGFAAKGVYSSQMPIKQKNFYLHNLLEKYSEPFDVINSIFKGDSMYGFIKTAWRYLLQNQAHDSIWASSPDPIIQDIITRFRWSEQIADEVFRRVAHEIIAKMKIKSLELSSDSKKGSSAQNKYYITIFNPSAWPRSDCIFGTISIKKSDVGKPLILKDCFGKKIECKFMMRSPNSADRMRYRTFVGSHGPLPSNLVDFLFKTPKIPALGYKTFIIESENIDNEDIDEILNQQNNLSAEYSLKFVNASHDFLENDVVKVLIEKNGSLTIIDKENNAIYKGFNVFLDTGNKGCTYEYIPLENDLPITTEKCIAKSELVEACGAYSEIMVTIPWQLPKDIMPDFSARSKEKVDFEIKTHIRLFPGNNRRIDIRTEFVNRAKWHQLRVIFPTGLNVKKEFVKSHFQIIERNVDKPWDFEGKYRTTGVYPQHSFMGIYDEKINKGIAILNKGLPTYETYRDKDKNIIIALNLLRSTGQWIVHLHLDPNIETPNAQWLNKKITTEYSIIPMNKDWRSMKIHRLAEEFNSPFRYEEHWDVFRLKRYELDKIGKETPPIYSLIEILEGEVEITAVKQVENNLQINKKLFVVRLYNLTDSIQNVKLRVGAKIKDTFFIKLNEKIMDNNNTNESSKLDIVSEKLEDLRDTDWKKMSKTETSILSFKLMPYKIQSLLLEIEL